MLTTVISGGQTGADQGGLAAALALGLKTSGYMPQGFLTEHGPMPEIAKLFNLIPHSSTSWLVRTRANILAADGTIIFGNQTSPGSQQTWRIAKAQGLPIYSVPWTKTKSKARSEIGLEPLFHLWLIENNIRTLNVAGNRESVSPGIHNFTYRYLVLNLGAHLGLTPTLPPDSEP